MSVNTSINSTASFTCEGEGFTIFFLINGISVRTNNVNFTAKGYRQTTNAKSNELLVGHLQVKAYEFNNRSRIACRVVSLNLPAPPVTVTSAVAELLIQGIQCVYIMIILMIHRNIGHCTAFNVKANSIYK